MSGLLLLLVADAAVDFETHIRPLLAGHCYECHAADAERIEGGLQLDSRAAMLAGGDSGPAIVPGDAEASYLIEVLRDVGYEMPPSGPLNAADVDRLAAWIDAGAEWPDNDDGPALVRRAFDLQERVDSHWAWQPVVDPPVPEVSRDDWPRDPIDRFVLAEIERAGLHPAAATDRATWLRRASQVIVGLPPTIAQIDRFLADDAPGAYERAADRLLASPGHGVAWARHWLDLVRYAESYGHEFDPDLPHADRYRDWVVRAINADVPLDRFAAEQIAGDRLPPRLGPDGTNEAVTATGFWHLGEALRAPVDFRGDEADRMENQIDVFSKSFLGLSVACARCHDHKFDAISTRDYYALFGSLRSSRRVLTPLDPGGRIDRAAADLDAMRQTIPRPDTPRPWDRDADGESAAIPPLADWTADGAAWSYSDRTDVDWQHRRAIPPGTATTAARGDRLVGTLRSPNFTLTEPKVQLLVRTQPAKTHGDLEIRLVVANYFLAHTGALQFEGTLDRRVSTEGLWAWVTLTGSLKKFVGESVYLEVTDRGGSTIDIAAVRQTAGSPPKIAAADPVAVEIDGATAGRLQRSLAAAPPPVWALATAEAAGRNEPVHIRGSAAAHGELVPRGMLAACCPEPAADPGSGRLGIARATVAADNPLFARVAANRIWHHVFGRGLVATVDDFGVMGQPPSHPELLDHLAAGLVEEGWSRKRLLRRLVLSATFRQSSRTDPNLAARLRETDPTNRLLHRSPVRRLPAESIRDTLLAVAGRLDRSQAGGSVPVYLDATLTGRGRPKVSGPRDGHGRRSLYLAVRRNFLNRALLVFDQPQPSTPVGRRSRSNVPAQALAMLNDPLVHELASQTAARLLAEPSEGRLDRLWRRALGRRPTGEERAAAERFLADRPDAWAELAHVVFNMKEFRFVP